MKAKIYLGLTKIAISVDISAIAIRGLNSLAFQAKCYLRVVYIAQGGELLTSGKKKRELLQLKYCRIYNEHRTLIM